MSKMKQREAVYLAVTNTLNEHGINFEDGMNAGALLSKEMKGQVTEILLEGFNEGKIELGRTYDTPAELKNYVTGLISNWLRKDDRLNGGVKHEIKNKGSRAGAGDPQLKALKALIQTKTDPAEKAEIQKFIDVRVSEIQSSKAKQVVIDYNALPEELRKKFQA